MGIVIPPSITMVVYGSIANTSIADLFHGRFCARHTHGRYHVRCELGDIEENGYQGEGKFFAGAVLRSVRNVSGR